MANFTFHDGWIVRESERVPEEEVARSTVFALANGYMGLRGAGEEVPATVDGMKGCYVNGIYDTPDGKLTEREFPDMPDWTCLRLKVDGEPFELGAGEILEYARELNMRDAAMRRRVRWRSPSGKVVCVESERFLSMARVHLGVIRYVVSAEQDCRIQLLSGIDADTNNRWAHHVKECRADADGHRLHLEIDTFDPGYTVAVAALSGIRVGGEDESRARSVAALGRSVSESFEFDIQSGKSFVLLKYAAVYDSRFTSGSLREACEREVEEAFQKGYREIKDEHVARWGELWDASNLDIDGDDEAQLGIRFSIFHLLAAAPYHCDAVSIPARGLQGQDYYGSIFWDCEIFVFPMFAYTQPHVARNLVGYRIATLDGARRKARGLGFEGAYYAWQSQETGDEQCDLHVFTNPLTGEPIRSYFADEQIHISSDVAHALWQYFECTGDEQMWLDGGGDVLFEVARFFVSRATYDESAGRWVLRSVLGPDEYHERVDDNAFTNAFAAETLRKAALLWARLAAAGHQEISQKIGLDKREVSRWQEVLEKLYVPQPDPKTRLIEQFRGYFGLKDEPVEATLARLAHPELRCGPLGPFQETQNIKQADVIMLLYLLRDRFDAETKRANWAYYEPRTAHESSLSAMAYSLVAADVGMVDWAYRYYMRTSHVDLESFGPHWNLGVHTAGLGGAWLAIVQGFCGLQLSEYGPRLLHWPRLPEKWKKVDFKFVWHGLPVSFTAEPGRVTMTLLAEGRMTVRTPDGEHGLANGFPMTWEYLAPSPPLAL
jgi:trehalose/maltose hydrolase-like predicted phosphorylase